MDARVFGTGHGQNWRVTGLRAGDPHPDYPPHVRLEFWIGGPEHGWRYNGPDSLDPDLARLLGQHLIEMADHSEGNTMSNISIGAEDIENRFGFHKATAETAPLIEE